MKKIILLSAFLVLCSPFLAFASRNHHRYSPPPVNTPTTSFQVGFFQGPSGVPSSYSMSFTDGAFVGGSNQVVFLEPPYNDSGILAGKFDGTLKTFSQSAAKYQNVIIALAEEENCVGNNYDWSIGYDGNTVASSIQTIQHESNIIRAYAPNVKIAQDLNADNCNGTYPTASYFASGVDLIGLDNFGSGESWSSLFQTAINNLKGLKPIDILSEGSSGNQTQFIQQTVAGAEQNGIQLVMYYNASPFNAPVSTLSML